MRDKAMRIAPKTELPNAAELEGEWSQRREWVTTLSETERKLIIDALAALLRERSVAFEIASSITIRAGFEKLDVRAFGLTDILRLSRRLEST